MRQETTVLGRDVQRPFWLWFTARPPICSDYLLLCPPGGWGGNMTAADVQRWHEWSHLLCLAASTNSPHIPYLLPRSSDTRRSIYSSWQRWHRRNTAVLFGRLQAAVRYAPHPGLCYRRNGWPRARSSGGTRDRSLSCVAPSCIGVGKALKPRECKNSGNKANGVSVSESDVTFQTQPGKTLQVFALRLIWLCWHSGIFSFFFSRCVWTPAPLGHRHSVVPVPSDKLFVLLVFFFFFSIFRMQWWMPL